MGLEQFWDDAFSSPGYFQLLLRKSCRAEESLLGRATEAKPLFEALIERGVTRPVSAVSGAGTNSSRAASSRRWGPCRMSG
jgi:hypothetical protein